MIKERLFSRFLFITALAALAYYGNKFSTPPLDSAVQETVNYQKGEMFGISLLGFSDFTDIIQPNQFLSDILLSANVSYQTIDAIAKKAKNVFDVRQIRAGRPYTILCDENDDEAKYFIYENDPTSYVVFDLNDSLCVQVKQRDIVTRTVTASGIIESSLSETMAQQNLSPKLTMELSDVFAWTVDFFHLQKGDWFKVIYEEKYADGQFVGIGEIKSAAFNHYGQTSYAIYFEEGDTNGYFDENANRIQRTFLKSPVKFSRISSGYSKKRFHPVLKTNRAHLGTDFAAPSGTPIYATADGVLTKVGYTRGNGNYVKIRHNQVYETQYLHMSKFAQGMKPGKHVRQGEVIGYVGSTGLATGPHVCYRFWKNGVQVDPMREKFPSLEPIKADLKPAYEKVRDVQIPLIEKIALPELETETLATVQVQNTEG